MARRNFDDFLKDLTKGELETLIEQANKRLNEIKRVYLRLIAKGRYDYIYATWQENGTTKQKSLGQRTERPERPKRPNPCDYRINDKQAKKLGEENIGTYKLDAEEFEEYWGIPQNEDKLDRPTKLLINYSAWRRAVLEYESLEKLANNPYSKYGVNSLKGIAFLNRMVESGHEVFVTYRP